MPAGIGAPQDRRSPARRVLSPGEVILLLSWLDYSAADAFRTTVTLHGNARLRQVRVVRDYGMYDRRGEPQYYPEVPDPEHSGQRRPL